MKSFIYTNRSCFHPFLLLFMVACSANLFAQVPVATISVQGVLTKSDGTAVDDGNDYVLTFRLWDDETSNDINAHRVHLETITDITIVGGVYSVVLGLSTPLTAPFNKVYWLGVSVGTSSTELLPRPRLTHAPYALGLVGQNNKFPSTGPVIADAYRAKGGPAVGGSGQDGNGFSFQPGGDENGGMFSDGANNIELWAGGSKRAKLTNAQNEWYGQTINFGAFTSNDLTVNGNQQVNGGSTVTNGQTVSGGQTVNGNALTNGKVLTTAAGGYSFNYDNGYDTGLFGTGTDGEFILKTNGQNRVWCAGNTDINSPNDINLNAGNGNGAIKLNAHVYAPGMLLSGNGGLGVFYDNNSKELTAKTSSRRFKNNIRPFEDNFRLILQAQPKIYNRPGSPDPTASEIGYIAEEMDSLGLKNLVIYDQDGKEFSLHYDLVPIYNLEILKEHDKDIQQLRTELEALKAENAQLHALNASLQTDKNGLQSQQASFNTQLELLSKRMKALEMVGTGK